MKHRTFFVLLSAFGLIASLALAAPAPGQTAPARLPKPRQLAPGVITIVPPESEEKETFTDPREVVELVKGMPDLDWKPQEFAETTTLMSKAEKAIFRRSIWYLEFSFKPVRMIYVDIPEPSGKMQRKLLWYMVYKVTNRGGHIRPVAQADQWGHETYTTERVDYSVRFFPQFFFEAHEFKKVYLDRVVPIAVPLIQQREDPAIPLLNTVEMSRQAIPVSKPGEEHSVWGVAIWEDVDPRTDYFSVYVRGLTNAYRWEDNAEAFNPGDEPGTGRRYTYKTLQLNFWRPGDAVSESEEEIKFGLPKLINKPEKEILSIYQLEEPLDYRWVYR